MIIVTGATGQLGKAILERLLKLVPRDQVVACARDPGKAKDLTSRNVQVRQADFAQPETLKAAFRGATQILLVSSNARAYGGDPLVQHHAAIMAAKAAGVRRILYTSHMGVNPTSAFPPMRDHAATEGMLAGSGLKWTSLRHGFYASTVPMLVGKAAETGTFAAPEDGKVSWTTHADLAEADARITIDEKSFDGPTPPLTASDALDLTDVAAMLSSIFQRSVTRKLLSDQEQQSQLIAMGLPAGAIAISMSFYKAARAGEFASTSSALGSIIGRPPLTLRAYLEAEI